MKRNDRAIVSLVMLAHAMVHTYELSLPIFVTVWLTTFETISVAGVTVPVTEASLGLVVGAGYALFGIGALPGGMLADIVGSRRLIVGCLAGMGGSFLLLALSPNVLVVALALLVWGAAASVYHPSGLALISKGVEARGSAFAYHGMAGNLGIALGPLVTTILLLFFDWQLVAAALVVPALVGAVFAVRIDIDESAAVATDGGDSKADAVTSLPEFLSGSKRLFAGSFVLIFGVVIMSGLYYRGVLTFLPNILGDFAVFDPVQFAGQELEPARYVYVGLLMVGMAGQFAGGKLTDRLQLSTGIIGAFGTLAVLALLFLPAANAGLLPFLALCALLGFFLFLVQPFYQATVADLTPAGTRGLSYGYTYLGVFGIGAAGGALAGAILTYASATELFLALAVFGSIASGLGIAIRVREGE